jgi:penicillin-binding protein 1A
VAQLDERPAAGRPLRRPRRRRWLRRLIGVVLALAVALAVLVAQLQAAGWVLTPSVDDAANRVAKQLDAHHAAALQGEVPSKLAEALTATEDSRFFHTPGVDPLGMIREPLGAITGHDEGGATLEQQLAKNLYEQQHGSLLAKGAEVVLALKLDRAWTKQQILRLYVDDGYYGHGFYGLTDAAHGYFGVEPAQLTWAQASLLAGLFQAPSAYDPIDHPAAARARQAHVLDRLVATGHLTQAQADRVAKQSWSLVGQ